MRDAEVFEIDTELTRDAIKAGVWSRVCAEMADREEDAIWRPRVEPLATKRGEGSTAVLENLAAMHIGYLADARRRFIAVEETPLGSTVELDDILRFMPKAWHEETNRWLWLGEARDMESQGRQVVWVRAFGTDEHLRGD